MTKDKLDKFQSIAAIISVFTSAAWLKCSVTFHLENEPHAAEALRIFAKARRVGVETKIRRLDDGRRFTAHRVFFDGFEAHVLGQPVRPPERRQRIPVVTSPLGVPTMQAERAAGLPPDVRQSIPVIKDPLDRPLDEFLEDPFMDHGGES